MKRTVSRYKSILIRMFILCLVLVLGCKGKAPSEVEVDRYARMLSDHYILNEMKRGNTDGSRDSIIQILQDSFHHIHKVTDSTYDKIVLKMYEDPKLSQMVEDRMRQLFKEYER